MACGCNKNRATASGGTPVSGTYRVLVSDRQVYESSSPAASDAVAARFGAATVHNPDGTTTDWLGGKPVVQDNDPVVPDLSKN